MAQLQAAHRIQSGDWGGEREDHQKKIPKEPFEFGDDLLPFDKTAHPPTGAVVKVWNLV